MGKMAVKKTKKAVENINSRLRLVMKSGKYHLGYRQTLKTLRQGKAKLVILAPTALLSGNRRLSTTLCWPRLVSIITLVTTLSWELLAVNTSECALLPSPIQVTVTSSEVCLPLLVDSKCNIMRDIINCDVMLQIKNHTH